MKEQIKHYEATGKLLTHPHVLCSKCQGKTTMFGTNLEARIKRYSSLSALLEGFECRNCRPKQNKPHSDKAPSKKRGSKGAAKVAKTQEMLRDLPKMQFSDRTPVVLLDNPGFAAMVTSVACQRPDLFLNAGRKCIDCNLYSVCAAPCKNLGKKHLAA